MMTHLWLIPAVPAAAALVLGLLGIRWFSRAASAVVACAAIGAALVASLLVLGAIVSAPAEARISELVLGDWIPEIPLATAGGIGMFRVAWSLRVDPLASVMLLVVTGIGFWIHLYATAYMRDEPAGAYARFFAYMNLFCAFMLLLVLAGNFVVLFVGWEGVGLCSYLLIGFWYRKPSAADAGKKAFLVNRIGDLGFLLGIFLVFFTFGTTEFPDVAAAAAALPRETAGFGVLSAICLLLCVGAVGKSAQIPLFVWLPDAMEGPTPVSALIHAATMVTAGVYVIARNAVLFEQAPLVLHIVATVGAVTALSAAAVALVQTDIKRVLAFSTVSQVGYMFVAAGVGAFGAAIFHLATHAFFKALLFLGGGSVIHALSGEQDMRRMGGLRRRMPITAITMSIGALALAGIPPLSGFFSKDAIQLRALGASPVLFVVVLGASLLSALYIGRLMCLTFFGPYRGPAWSPVASPDAATAAAVHRVGHPRDAQAHGQAQRARHEVTHGPAAPSGSDPQDPDPGLVDRESSVIGLEEHHGPRAMWVPLVALAAGVVLSAVVGIPAALGGGDVLGRFLEPSVGGTGNMASLLSPAAVAPPGRLVELAVMALSVLVAGAAVFAARLLYVTHPDVPGRVAARWPRVHAALGNQLYVDALYRTTVVRPTLSAARTLALVDRRILDAAVDGVGSLTQIAAWISRMTDKHVVDGVVGTIARGAARLSFQTRRLQTGLVQNYALLMACGLFAFLTLYLLGGW